MSSNTALEVAANARRMFLGKPAWTTDEMSPGSLSAQSTDLPSSPNILDSDQHASMEFANSGDCDPQASMGIVQHGGAEAWASHTESKLNHAATLMQEVEGQVKKNNSVINHTRIVQTVQNEIKTKINETVNLSGEIEEMLDRVEDVARKTAQSHLILQRAFGAKRAPLIVVKRRMEIRATRPIQELTVDEWSEAMEAEKQTLTDSRRELAANIQITKDKIPLLDTVKEELLDDLHRKRYSQHIDHLCIIDGTHHGALKPWSLESMSLDDVMHSGAPESPGGAERGTEPINMTCWVNATKNTLVKGDRLCEEAEMQVEKNRECMANTLKACNKANAWTVECMNAHISFLQSRRKPIEDSLMDVEKALHIAKFSAEKTTKKLKQHEMPLQSLNRKFSLRQQRHTKENIRDPVHGKLEEHFETLKQTVQTLSSNVDGTTDLVQELINTKRELSEALHYKNMAVRIDMSCTKVTLKSVAGHYFNGNIRASASLDEDLDNTAAVCSKIFRRTSSPTVASLSQRNSCGGSPTNSYTASPVNASPRSPRVNANQVVRRVST
eukprot:TRINITY_DN48185_c0_g1_i1.p1 TRINITY_DN48185_c0_g1~~TRINITY_DN48185_c0_g1_i1.p1  ORF type:complete len:581 (-),score=124.73 TRINITY_DN48185_c0_g1_i1:232-1896(-)